MRTPSVAARLVAVVFSLAVLVALTGPADAQSDVKVLVGKWVWNHSPSCLGCSPFTMGLTISSVSPDGKMSGTFRSVRYPNGVKVAPRATVTDGRIKVALKIGELDFDLGYAKNTDSLAGPVTGLAPKLMVRDAAFFREK